MTSLKGMQRRLLLFLFTLLSIGGLGHATAQTVDAEWYQQFFSGNPSTPVEEALSQRQKALEQANQKGDTQQKAVLLNELGLLHLTRTRNFDKAMENMVAALALEDSLQLRHEEVFTYMGIARIFEEVGDYYKSAQFLEQALSINGKLNNMNVRVLIDNKLGEVNAALGKIDEAFTYYQQILDYKDELLQPEIEAEALMNLAHLHMMEKEYPKALETRKKALSILRSIPDRKNEAANLQAIGDLYLLMRNESRAMANYVASLEIRQELEDKLGQAASYNDIGALYFQQDSLRKAVNNLRLGLTAAQEAQAQHEIRKSYKYLSKCYRGLNNYKKALEYQDLFLAINDFIENENSERQLLEIQNRYVIDKKQSQINALEINRVQREKKLEAQQRFQNFLMICIGLILVIVILVLYLYFSKRRSNRILQEANTTVENQNEELQELNSTKDKFFSIISHDLKGPLNSLTSFSGLLMNHTEAMSKEEIKMLATDLDKSLKNLFALLENLLEWSRSQTGNIDFTPEEFDLKEMLEENKTLLEGQAQNKKIEIVCAAQSSQLVKAHKNSITTVIRNLLSNAIKFTPEEGTITLNTVKQGNEIITAVQDTGVGIPPDVVDKLFRLDTKHSTKGTANEKGTGLGLVLCREFVEKNGGRIWVKSEEDKGSTFYFSLPANA